MQAAIPNPPISPSPGRKRPSTLTLSDNLVQQAWALSSNLSGVVETLLLDYVRQQTQAQQRARQEDVASAQAWNSFNGATGSFADEYSTL
ncbi:MAG: type II toxin-antitoxin system CcdA family antitoxin [Polaromonas sp.]|nr:type II toxin-antitoxin system CcdA family antitoxin [Polaromonas sp.]